MTQSPPKTRAAGIAKRRELVVAAAHTMIKETGDVDMRGLAALAGVSYATPFNLFGGKREVLLEISARDLDEFIAAFNEKASADSLDRLFDLVRIGIARFRNEPDFHRALMRIIIEAPSGVKRVEVRYPRNFIYIDLVRRAQGEKSIRRGVDAEILANAMIYLYVAAIMDWVAGEIDLDMLETSTCFGFASLLKANCTAKVSARLADAMILYQNRIVAMKQALYPAADEA
jgi:AcrR family transcriptional regulator